MAFILAGAKENAGSGTSEKASIRWHPGFYGAAELELISDQDVLEFQREYILGKEPVRMDLLIIKKLADVRAFLRKTGELTKPGDRKNADAVLQVSICANEELYEKIRRDSGMCEALRRLMKDEIAETIAETLAEGMEKGMEKGMDNAMLSAIANLMDTMKWTAEQAMEAIKVPLADRGRYRSQL